MKKNVSIVFSTLVAAMTFFSCGTQQTATKPAAAPVHRDSIVAVEPLKEVITIAEALDMYQNPDKAAAITKKYGYKLKPNYEVYRLDKFSKMYYKNCTLAKLLTAEAEAQAIRKIAQAVEGSGANPAQYLIAVRYLETLKEMTSGQNNKTVYLPYEASGVLSSLGGIKELLK